MLVRESLPGNRTRRLLLPFGPPHLHHSGRPAGTQGRWFVTRRPAARVADLIARWPPVLRCRSGSGAVDSRQHAGEAIAEAKDWGGWVVVADQTTASPRTCGGLGLLTKNNIDMGEKLLGPRHVF